MEGFNDGPVLEIKPKDLVYKLLNETDYYLRDVTSIMINNRTDPFLRDVIPYTLEILDELILNKIKSPIIIISKFAPPKDLKNYFNKLNINFFYSYSGIDTDFNYKKVDEDIKVINEIIPKRSRFHYFRPIIPGLNNNYEYMKEVLLKFKNGNFNASVIAGFRVTNLNKHLIKDEAIDVNKIDYNHKLVDSSIYNINNDLISDSYRIFRHTSCAINSNISKANSLNYFNKDGHCFSKCPNYEICSKKKINLNNILNSLNNEFKDKYSFMIKDNSILIDSLCDQELTSYIKNAYGCNVICENVGLSKSEEIILKDK